MAVATGIVEAHGGEIRVWNEPGVGNRFVVDLPFPIATPTSATESTSPQYRPRKSQTTVLIPNKTTTYGFPFKTVTFA